jgi:peroxiredoxin
MPTESSFSLDIDSPLPVFSLPDVVHGKTVSSSDFAIARAVLVIFICKHCPYVVHVREEVVRLAADYFAHDVACVAIASNDAIRYPDDAPNKLREMAVTAALPFPVLYDETQQVARAFGAACTPDFFLFYGNGKLAYRGRLDDSTPGNKKPVTGADLRAALDAVLAGSAPCAQQHPGVGCSIKWK